jgi:hypothetical protein
LFRLQVVSAIALPNLAQLLEATAQRFSSMPIIEDKMNELVLADRAAEWRRLKALVLDSVSSPITPRVNNRGLVEFFEWYGREPRPGFTKRQ